MLRMYLTERQQSRMLTAWLTGLTVSTAMHFWSPRHPGLQNLALDDAPDVGQRPCQGPSTLFQPLTTPTTSTADVVEVLLEGPLEATDERLVEWVRLGGGGRVFPPSTLPYNITWDNPGGWRDSVVWKFYSQAVNKYFSRKHGGFFVEAGALDGVLLSATLHLEQDLGWSGLLVEPRPDMFQQLLHKHRKAHSARFCLSEKSYPHKTSFWMSPDYLKDSIAFSAVSSQLFEKVQDSERETGSVVKVHCVPLQTLLRSIDRTHVDLFVLDVEGVEWGVIDLFPFNHITIDMLAVERKDKGEADRAGFIRLVESKGFTLAHDLKEDFIFIRKGAHFDINEDVKPADKQSV